MTELAQTENNVPPHILVVDDEPEIRKMVSLCLQKNNLRISCAESSAEACKLLVLEQFDAVVSDVMMPGEDGITFLGRVHESWPELPVILMTGHAQLQMAVNAIKNGAFDFVYKPFDFDHLRKIVIRALDYCHLQRMEKNYRAELEATVSKRTAELKESMAELDFTRAALQQAATDKSTFMSTVSHEMRTPMNGVMGSLELLSEENLTGAAAEYLAMARDSADSMMKLIEQMLSFNAQLAQNGGSIQRDLIEVAAFFRTMITGHVPSFARKKLTLSLLLGNDLPHQIWTDKEKLSRLFEILLNNALKFTEQGSVTLEVSRVTSEENGDQLLCTVIDSGIGIPEGMLEKIFEPFVQGDGSFSRRYEGVGLGLSIARQNALLLNGTVWAEHAPSGGSRFSVIFKICMP
ncbi:MAG: response regulator [Desulfuromonadaceae bacterium]|nr:response regulator [Desulfuromonadaceae bacterium]MDD5105275.1 response regulator [Desulfuromonadaceae bacterium]